MKTTVAPFANPFRPGAGHMPPYLAGRQEEELVFRQLLKQDTILQNMILTGLRGVGKTVLLETLKPQAIKAGWLWVGTDLSESVSVSEENLATRILADLAVLTSAITMTIPDQGVAGFMETNTQVTLNYSKLKEVYERTPGLSSDKLKTVLEYVWFFASQLDKRGIIFAYDEAQNLSDSAAKDQFPLSLLLDVFQSIQRKNVRFMLVLTGLPTLFPRLVEARTYSERMFRVVFLKKLGEDATREAILRPIKDAKCPVRFDDKSVTTITRISGGYPYFIQFICREVYDRWIQQIETAEETFVPVTEILEKLDSDFFAGRWARVTERQKDLLRIIAELPSSDNEFTVQEIVGNSKQGLRKEFGNSQVNRMLSTLGDVGLVYKNRHGKYSFAVPMFGQFIIRHVQATA
jgi:hypothetical protein